MKIETIFRIGLGIGVLIIIFFLRVRALDTNALCVLGFHSHSYVNWNGVCSRCLEQNQHEDGLF